MKTFLYLIPFFTFLLTSAQAQNCYANQGELIYNFEETTYKVVLLVDCECFESGCCDIMYPESIPEIMVYQKVVGDWNLLGSFYVNNGINAYGIKDLEEKKQNIVKGSMRYEVKFMDGRHGLLTSACVGGCESLQCERRSTTNRNGKTYTTGNSQVPGNKDITLTKFDENHNYSYFKQIGGAGADFGYGIDTDINENVSITGEFQQVVEFKENTILGAFGGSDIFLMKTDHKGNVLWAKGAGGAGQDIGYDVATNAGGTNYITGFYTNTANFEGTNLGQSGSGKNAFLAKYNNNGVLKWAVSLGGMQDDVGYSVVTDKYENAYVTGYFTDEATFGNETITAAGTNLFLVKYESDGNFAWVKTHPNVKGKAIALDYLGNIIIAGQGDIQLAMLKYTPYGILASEQNYPTNVTLQVTDLTTKGDHSLLIGQFSGDLLIDGILLESLGGQDIFLAEFKSNLVFEWAKNEGGNKDDYGLGIFNECSGHTSYSGCHFGMARINGEVSVSIGEEFSPFAKRIDDNCAPDPTVVYDYTGHSFSVSNVYPNPFEDRVNFTVKTDRAADMELALYDILGRNIKQNEYKLAKGEETLNLSLGADLPKGIYFLSFKIGTEVFTQKLIR